MRVAQVGVHQLQRAGVRPDKCVRAWEGGGYGTGPPHGENRLNKGKIPTLQPHRQAQGLNTCLLGSGGPVTHYTTAQHRALVRVRGSAQGAPWGDKGLRVEEGEGGGGGGRLR